MRGIRKVVLLLIVSSPILGALPLRAFAQCSGPVGLGGVSSMSGNPFQAEVKQTFINHSTTVVHNLLPMVQFVARDTQGRVRIDRSGGKFKVQNGSDEGTEQEQHHISICDPVKQESILLDTLNKTATVQKSSFPSGSLRGPALPAAVANFCSRHLVLGAHLPGAETEDLGHRTIEGIDAEGVRTKRAFPMVTNGTTTSQLNVTETWCSEELGAVILRVSGTEEKGDTLSTAMINIQRGEPDPLLFQIPPDYRVVERVNEPGVRQGTGVTGGFITVSPSTEITTVPSKP